MVRITALGLALVCLHHGVARADEPAHSAELDAMIMRQAKRHGVPETLVRRIVMRESRYNPRARNHSFWGLMQISYPTARSMGFKGSPSELLNPVTNLTYAVPYLANAFIIAGKREDAAVRLYASGYYAAARSRGLLGALRTADSKPLSSDAGHDIILASADPASQPPPQQDFGPFGALFSPSPDPVAGPSLPLATLPDGRPTIGQSAELVAGNDGTAAPPKKWKRDGGVTLVARGEQHVEQVAAFSHTTDEPQPGPRRARHGKATTFAALELPTNGQAYAAAAGDQSSSLAQAAPQAAIAQATSGPSASKEPADVAREPSVGEDVARPAGKTKRAHAKRHVASRIANAKATGSKASRTAAAQQPDIEQAPVAAPATGDAQ